MEQENTRSNKIARQIQRDMSEIIQREGHELSLGTLVSVTNVRMSPDLGLAKINVSIFPHEKGKQVLDHIEDNSKHLRYELGRRMKDQMRVIPEIVFYLDDSLEYMDNMNNILKNL